MASPSGPVSAKVVVHGLADTSRVLREIAPEVGRRMDREIRTALQPVLTEARSLVPAAPPLSRWQGWSGRLDWDGGFAKSGIRIKKGGRRTRGTTVKTAWSIINEDPAGAVFEMAGRTSGGSSPQGRAFIRNLNRKWGPASRTTWRAWDRTGAERRIVPQVERTIRRYESETQRLLDAAGGG